jgi:hypothetical protein
MTIDTMGVAMIDRVTQYLDEIIVCLSLEPGEPVAELLNDCSPRFWASIAKQSGVEPLTPEQIDEVIVHYATQQGKT